MRIRHLLTSAVPVMVMLLTSLSAQAQYGMPSPSVGPAYFNGSPGSSGVAPSQFRPSPGISPFDHMFDQTYNSNGMWFRNQTNGFGPFNHPRKWSFNVDYTRTKTRKLAGYIGADNVQTYLQQNDPENDGVVTDDSFYPYFDAAPASISTAAANPCP